MTPNDKFPANYEATAFSYPFYYEGKVVDCHIVPGESGYGILFDGKLVAELAMNENTTWEQTSGNLDEDTVYSIGLKISDHFE